MSYAIVKTGGKQYKIEEGQELLIEKIAGAAGDKIELDDVLMTSKDGKVAVSGEKPAGKVKATVIGQVLDDKVIIFKYKPKKRYRRKIGHRQPLTMIKIDKISFSRAAKAKAEDVAAEE